MREYDIYDQAVDVVSAFEFLFTDPARHGNHSRVTSNGSPGSLHRHETADPDTPDFTVLFTDGTALVGEIARLSLQSKSVDSACAQLARYDALHPRP